MGMTNRETNESLVENRAWQKVPGCSGAEFHPIIRKPDATCSNCFLLRTSQCLVAVDPGADSAQTASILEVLNAQLRERPRPVLIILTHCHRDHAWHAGLLASRLEGAAVHLLAQEAGARALSERNRELTAAYLFKEEVPSIGPIIPLLSEADRTGHGSQAIPPANDILATLRPENIALENGASLFGQALCIGGDEWLHVFHAPGHSPDSVILKLGNLLFLGDLTFAANPGVAGVIGWDQPALLQSLALTAELIRRQSFEICCPSHGSPMPPAKALKVLESARTRAAELSSVARLDADRALYLKDYTESTLQEASELFTRLGGKLYSLSFRMEQLAEPEEAQRILEALDVASIDSYLTDFQHFTEVFDCSTLEMALPLKGMQVFGKIESVLSAARLTGLIDPSLLRRARRLLTDFINTTQGLPARDFSQPEDINLLLLEALSEVLDRPGPGPELMNSLEDPRAFARALTERIARQPVISRASLRLDAEIGIPKAMIAKANLADGIISLLERLAVRGAEQILVRTLMDSSGQRIQIQITAAPLTGLDSLFSDHKARLLRSALQPHGGELTFDPAAQPESIILTLPAAWME